jgi:hypothetical protein
MIVNPRLGLALMVPCLLAACPGPAVDPHEPATKKGAAPTAKKKLVVLVVVDQLPSWTFSRHLPAFRGGFARLVREGVFWPRAEYPYAATLTAIGHTALATGAEPRRSGIVGNQWWDRASERWVDTTEDAAHPTVPSHSKDDGASPRSRLVEAVGAGRRVLSISYKERAAVLMAPSQGAVVAWYEPKQQAFVTSTQYAAGRPAWLETLARERPIAARFDFGWTPLPETPARALVPDLAPGETEAYGLGQAFPHRLSEVSRPEKAIGATPLASEILLEAVLAGLAANDPELLDVSFSAHDLAAHAWGQESWEATDVLFRLDATLGSLLDALDARYGKDGWSLVFSSDHGGPAMPERTPEAARIDKGDVLKVAVAAAGDAKWIAASDERMIYLSRAALSEPEATRARMLDAIVTAMKSLPGIGFAIRTDRFHGNGECTGLDAIETLVCRSLYEERVGDIYYGPTEGSFVQARPFDAVSHGTPYAYDRLVPLVVREPGRAARVLPDEHPSPLRVAPTVARLLGAHAPPAAREPSL